MKKYFLSFFVLLAACYNEDDYEFLDISNARLQLDIFTTKVSVMANEKDTIYVRAKIPYKLSPTTTKMKFTLSSGTFLESKSNEYEPSISYFNNSIEEFSFADAHIVSSLQPGQSDLNIQVDKFNFFKPFIFEKNFPDTVITEAGAITYKKDPFSQITVNSVLKSGDGKVSNGHSADVKLYNESWGIFGTQLSKSPATSNDIQTFKFSSMPDSGYVGKVYAVSSTVSWNNREVKDTITLYIIK